MAIFKHKSELLDFECKDFLSYKKKIKKVASKIDTWHNLQLKQGKFGNDNEFVNL